MITAKSASAGPASTGTLTFGPFPSGTTFREFYVYLPLATSALIITFRAGLFSTEPRGPADFDAGLPVTAMIGVDLATNYVALRIPVNKLLDAQRIVAVEFTNPDVARTVGIGVALGVETPTPISIDEVAQPAHVAADARAASVPAPRRSRRPADPSAPRSSDRGNGDIVFVRLVKQALGDFFGQAPGPAAPPL